MKYSTQMGIFQNYCSSFCSIRTIPTILIGISLNSTLKGICPWTLDMEQSIREWNKKILRKTAFKNFEVIWSAILNVCRITP